jgi:hypothetical protein
MREKTPPQVGNMREISGKLPGNLARQGYLAIYIHMLVFFSFSRFFSFF